MKKYKVIADEILTYEVEVEAESEEDAIYEADQIIGDEHLYESDWQYHVEIAGE